MESHIATSYLHSKNYSETTSKPALDAGFKPLSRLEVSRILQVSIRTLENWQKAGRMPQSVNIGGRVYWHPQVFYDWLDKKLRPPASESSASTAAPMPSRTSSLRPSKHLSSAEHAISRNRDKLNKMLAGN